MEQKEARGYLSKICNICDWYSSIKKNVEAAEKILCQLGNVRTISFDDSNKKVYTLNYEPVIEPIKNMYQKYVITFASARERFRQYVKWIMDDIASALLEKATDTSNSMKRLEKEYGYCDRARYFAQKIFDAMEAVVEIMSRVGADDSKLISPAQIENFINDTAGMVSQYDSNLEIIRGFEELKGTLRELNEAWGKFFTGLSDFPEFPFECDFTAIFTSLSKIYQSFLQFTDTKKGKKNTVTLLQQAESVIKALRAQFALEMQKRIAPISTAFDRIEPKVPDLPSDSVFSVTVKGNGLVASRMNAKELLQKLQDEAVATITLSTACAVTENGKDCKGQFSLKVLKQKHVISSDAQILFVVDDGYSALSLSERELIDANDFSVEDEIYFSQSALEKLKKLFGVAIKVE